MAYPGNIEEAFEDAAQLISDLSQGKSDTFSPQEKPQNEDEAAAALLAKDYLSDDDDDQPSEINIEKMDSISTELDKNQTSVEPTDSRYPDCESHVSPSPDEETKTDFQDQAVEYSHGDLRVETSAFVEAESDFSDKMSAAVEDLKMESNDDESDNDDAYEQESTTKPTSGSGLHGFLCRLCGEEFSTWRINTHVQQQHMDIPSYKCSHCETMDKDWKALRSHKCDRPKPKRFGKGNRKLKLKTIKINVDEFLRQKEECFGFIRKFVLTPKNPVGRPAQKSTAVLNLQEETGSPVDSGSFLPDGSAQKKGRGRPKGSKNKNCPKKVKSQRGPGRPRILPEPTDEMKVQAERQRLPKRKRGRPQKSAPISSEDWENRLKPQIFKDLIGADFVIQDDSVMEESIYSERQARHSIDSENGSLLREANFTSFVKDEMSFMDTPAETSHSQIIKYECKICHEQFTGHERTGHVKSHHFDLDVVKCVKCDFTSKHAISVVSHYRATHGKRKWKDVKWNKVVVRINKEELDKRKWECFDRYNPIVEPISDSEGVSQSGSAQTQTGHDGDQDQKSAETVVDQPGTEVKSSIIVGDQLRRKMNIAEWRCLAEAQAVKTKTWIPKSSKPALRKLPFETSRLRQSIKKPVKFDNSRRRKGRNRNAMESLLTGNVALDLQYIDKMKKCFVEVDGRAFGCNSKTKRKYFCKKCQVSFQAPSYNVILGHIHKKHIGIKAIYCGHCEYSTHTPMELRSHRVNRHPRQPLLYTDLRHKYLEQARTEQRECFFRSKGERKAKAQELSRQSSKCSPVNESPEPSESALAAEGVKAVPENAVLPSSQSSAKADEDTGVQRAFVLSLGLGGGSIDLNGEQDVEPSAKQEKVEEKKEEEFV